MPPEIFFNNEGVLAMTSEASIDFTPADFDSPLTVDQCAYLKKYSGRDIPQVFWRKQIHGDNILVAEAPVASAQGRSDADAFITNEKNLPIAIRTADCVPVFIFDTQHTAIGLAHAGWKGTYKSIAVKTVQKMQKQYASQVSGLRIVLGPSIRECCYKVGEEFRDYFPSHVRQKEGYLYADMIGANRDQLLQVGVRPENIIDSGLCTCCNKNYFSFRRDGIKAGRMISLIMLV
jgi:YfiH family protein